MKGLPIKRIGQGVAKLAFGLAGDGKETEITLYLGRAGGTYDPATDTEGPAGTTITDREGIVFKARNQQQGTDDISVNTRTLLIEAAQLPAGTKITEKDSVKIGDDDWNIVDAMLDPAEAIWTLELRR